MAQLTHDKKVGAFISRNDLGGINVYKHQPKYSVFSAVIRWVSAIGMGLSIAQL